MKKWIKDTAIKAVKTAAQAAVSMLTVGQLVTEVNWLSVLSVAAGAAIYSVLMNIANLETEGAENEKHI